MSPPSRRMGTAAAATLIALAALAAYRGTWGSPFVFLDIPAICTNPTIRHLWPLGPVLSPPSNGGLTVGGRPLVNLSLALNYAAGGLDPRGYHAVNLLIHLLAGLALFGIVRRTLERIPPAGSPYGPLLVAAAAALLWTLHPLQTESVTYVVQRAESLMGLLYLATVYGFIRGSEASEPAGRAWLGFSVLACLLGMATKEVMVSAPVLVLLYDRTFCGGGWIDALRRRKAYYTALAATWIPLAVLVTSSHGRGGTSGFEMPVSWGQYVLTQFPAAVRYLGLAVWPAHQAFYYPVSWPGLGDVAPQMAAVLLLAAGAAAALWRGSAWGYLGAWFFAILAPTSLIPGISQTVAEHRMYLALAPIAAGAAWGFWALCLRLGTRQVWGFSAAAALLCACLAEATVRRNAVYASEVSLWTDTVARSPESPYVQVNAGVALASAGRREEAISCFRNALKLEPRYAEAHNNLGLALAQTGRLQEALAEFRGAIQCRPAYPEAEANLGATLAQAGRPDEAIPHLRRALELDPGYLDARNNLAAALSQTGRTEESVREYGAVVKAQPERAESQFNLGNALASLGRWAEAEAHYRMALHSLDGDGDLHANLGAALANLGRMEEAVAEYRRALALNPSDRDVAYNLDLALRELARRKGRTP